MFLQREPAGPGFHYDALDLVTIAIVDDDRTPRPVNLDVILVTSGATVLSFATRRFKSAGVFLAGDTSHGSWVATTTRSSTLPAPPAPGR